MNDKMIEESLVNLIEACKMLGITKTTFYRWQKEGYISFRQIEIGPGISRFFKKEILDWINSKVEKKQGK